MRLNSSGGYLRLLNRKEFWRGWNTPLNSPERKTLAPPGMTWEITRLGLTAEVRKGSLEHQMISAPLYFSAHEFDSLWPDSASFLYCEWLFIKGWHAEFLALVIQYPTIADLISNATVRWHKHPCRVTQAQDLVRFTKTHLAAQVALKELE